MTLLKAYENKITEYVESSKIKQLPLLSWDIHMQNFKQLTNFNSDINCLKKINEEYHTEVNILNEFSENKSVIIVTDLDLYIEFATCNILEMSGYHPNEIIGCTPKIFQGPKTDKIISQKIRASLNNQEKFEFTLKNYRKDKSLYNCHIKGFPVFDKKGILSKYLAVEQVA